MFSSSKGNSTYIGNANGGILVDAGVSFSRIAESLKREDIPLCSINAILITHEHSDHVKGLKSLLKKCKIPVIASRGTIYALEFHKIIDNNTERIYIDETENYQISDFKICRFATSHDTVGSSGYVIDISDGQRVAVCTDLGIVTDEVYNSLKGADLVMLESNHDPVMLRLGPYPPELKIRIGGDKGHLSNAVSAELIGRLFKSGSKRFVLAHLSENNNTPEKAESATRAALCDAGADDTDYILYVAPEKEGRVINL